MLQGSINYFLCAWNTFWSVCLRQHGSLPSAPRLIIRQTDIKSGFFGFFFFFLFVAGSNYQAAKPAWPQYLTPTPKSSNHLMARRRVAGDPAFNTKHTLILLYGHLHRVGSGNVSKHQVPAVQLSVALVQRALRHSSVIHDDFTCNSSIFKKNKLKIWTF